MSTRSASPARPGGPRRALAAALLLAVPAALLARWAGVLGAKGPFWLGHNLDPDYQYLLNGLNLLHGFPPGHVDHPGTPVQVLVALIIAATHLLSGAGPVSDDVLQRPEHYLAVAACVLLALVAVALAVLGLAVLRATGSLLAGLAAQLLPGLSPVVALNVACVKPEPVLAALAALLAALVLRAPPPGRAAGRLPHEVALGIVSGLALATKISAAPLLVLPVAVLAGAAARARFAAAALATAAVATAPAWPELGTFRRFVAGIATHSGRYGTGRPSLLDAAEYRRGLAQLAGEQAGWVFLAVAAAGAAVAVALAWLGRRRPDLAGAPRRALVAAVATQAATHLLVARHPASHYLLPALVVAGLTAALAIDGLGRLVAAAPWPRRLAAAAAAALLAAALVRLEREGRSALHQLEAERAARQAVVARLERDFAGARVVHYYRSSSQAYALHFGDWYTRSRWSAQVEALWPRHLYYNIWNDRLEVYAPRPGDPRARPLDYLPLTREILCGPEGDDPVVLQGMPPEELPREGQGGEPLARRIAPVFAAGPEALSRPAGCTTPAGGAAPR